MCCCLVWVCVIYLNCAWVAGCFQVVMVFSLLLTCNSCLFWTVGFIVITFMDGRFGFEHVFDCRLGFGCLRLCLVLLGFVCFVRWSCFRFGLVGFADNFRFTFACRVWVYVVDLLVCGFGSGGDCFSSL